MRLLSTKVSVLVLERAGRTDGAAILAGRLRLLCYLQENKTLEIKKCERNESEIGRAHV